VKAAYSPAEALFNRLARNPCMGVKPACLAAIPREKDTAKYPRAMGKPSRIPSQNIFLLNLSFIVVKPHLSVRRLLAHMSYYNAHSNRRKGAKLTYITAFSA
jgi:hypothetical protein